MAHAHKAETPPDGFGHVVASAQSIGPPEPDDELVEVSPLELAADVELPVDELAVDELDVAPPPPASSGFG